jgi:hypothetical protein
MDDDSRTEDEELTSRAPTQEDFVKLCARLNELGALLFLRHQYGDEIFRKGN